MTPWTVAFQAPLSMEFSRPEYWNGYLFSSPGDLPDRGIKPGSPALQVNSLSTVLPGKQVQILILLGQVTSRIKVSGEADISERLSHPFATMRSFLSLKSASSDDG